jgi:chorismate-pyruvate lyase
MSIDAVPFAALLAAVPPAAARQASAAAPDAETLRTVQRLQAALLSHDSATAVLESWCEQRRMADPAKVTARLIRRADEAPPPEVARDLAARPGERVRYRRVELVCGGRVLSRADNWYLPDRLTVEMNRLLDETDLPFGKAVKSLGFRRRTLADDLFPESGGVLRTRAILSTPDGAPFSEVVETYSTEVLATGPATP